MIFGTGKIRVFAPMLPLISIILSNLLTAEYWKALNKWGHWYEGSKVLSPNFASIINLT